MKFPFETWVTLSENLQLINTIINLEELKQLKVWKTGSRGLEKINLASYIEYRKCHNWRGIIAYPHRIIFISS